MKAMICRTRLNDTKHDMALILRRFLPTGFTGTRENRKYLKANGIRYGGKPLGRPVKQTELNAEQIKLAKAQRKQDALERIPIEGKFGQGKNSYRLNCIRAKTAKTSGTWIKAIFLVMKLAGSAQEFVCPKNRCHKIQILTIFGRSIFEDTA